MSRQKILSLKFKDFAIKFLFFLCLFSQNAFGQNPPETTNLELNKPLTREISGKTKHSYQITLSENQLAKIIVEQRGIDVVVRLFGIDGKLLTSFDGERWTKESEKVGIFAKDAGTYKLEVSPVFTVLPAGTYQIHFTELREANENDKLLQEARIAYTESNNLRRQGNLKDAFTQIKNALETFEKVLGKDHTEVAITLDTVAFYYYKKGDLATSETILQRSLAIKEKNLDPDHPEIAQTLNSFALVTNEKGEYEKSEIYSQRAIQIREKSLGTNHPAVSGSLNSLASLYIDTAEYSKAEPLFLRSIEIDEKIYGKDHLETANAINNLGLLYSERGEDDKAEEFYQKALEIYEKSLPPEHPSIALALNNLATVYQEKNEFAKAELLLLRALAIREKTLGADNPEVAQTLYNIGIFYYSTNNFGKAEEMFKKSLAILEAKLGTEHIYLTYPLTSLGGFYRNKGEYEKSEEIFLRVLQIKEKVLGSFHPDVATTQQSLSLLYAAKGDAEKATTALKKASEINERALTLNLAVGSEKQKLAYISLLTESTEQILSIQNSVFPDNLKVRELAAETILQRKGRIQDAMVDTLGSIKQKTDGQQKILFDKLNEINSGLANLVLNEPKGISVAEYQNRIKSLEEEKEKLETEISRRNAEYAAQTQAVSLKTIRNAIETDTTLIEFAVYRSFDPKAKTKKDELGELRYVAYIINRQGDIKSHDLGKAEPLDAIIKSYRQAIADPKRDDFKKIARELDEKLMSPIRRAIGDKKHLLISPDGNLNLIPFEALLDENGKFLVENYAVSYLSSGRDLLRMQTPRESKEKTLVVANPNYGDPELPITAVSTRKPKRDAKRKSITATRNLTDTYFAPLGGTAQEARAIQTIFPEAVFLTQAQATETAVKKVNAPQILHLATHGFFLENFSNDTNIKIENPLLRSGLAFAGANKREKDGKEDGILTALEASSLNLWGTKLVVLSACDTGLGEIKNGEGVYGLRRAFILAGTESLVMSLWSVSDYVTREMMTNYYKNLKSGMGRGEAMRQVQLEMLKNPKRQHPFYWASFIQSGEWANLQGKR